jgi:hypothetical protein
MTTVAERLTQITLKVERAKEHIADLQRTIRRFLETNPYKVGTKYDPQSRKLIYYVTSAEPTPARLPLFAGDAIQNLISALDHLAYQIVCSDTGDAPPNPNWIYFPIADDAAKYEAKKGGKIQGARQETIDAIDALKPYKGGNDQLWQLYRLNNIEKHRLLLTVGSHASGVHLGQMVAEHLLSGGFPTEAVDAIKSMAVYLRPADTGFPLKAGFELLIGGIDEKPNPDQQFRFDVALSEPGIIQSKSLLETLHQFSALVEGIVSALTPRLRDTN